MPAGTFADPYVLDDTPGVNTISLSFHPEDVFDFATDFPVAYMKINTAEELRAIAGLAPGKISAYTFYGTVPGHSDFRFDYYNRWFASNAPLPFNEAFWSTTTLWIVFVDLAQDYSLSPTGTFAFNYTVSDVAHAPVFTPTAGLPDVTISDPTLLSTPDSSNLFTTFHVLQERIVVVWGSVGASFAALVNTDGDAPVLEQVQTFYTSSFIGVDQGYRVSDSKAVFNVFNYGAGFPYAHTMYEVTFDGTTLSSGPCSVTPTAFDGNHNPSGIFQIFQWTAFDDGSNKGIRIYSDISLNGGNPIARIIEHDEDGVEVDAGPLLTLPGGTSIYYRIELTTLSKGWIVVTNPDYGFYGLDIDSASLTLTLAEGPFGIPVPDPDGVEGGNLSDFIPVDDGVGFYGFYGNDPAFYGTAADLFSPLGYWIQTYMVDTSVVLTGERSIEDIHYRGWVGATYDAEAQSDLVTYDLLRVRGGPLTPSFQGVYYFFGNKETLDPTADGGFSPDWEWTEGPASMFRCSVGSGGMEAAELVVLPAALSTYVTSIWAIQHGTIMLASFYSPSFLGGDSKQHLVIFKAAGPDLTGLFLGARRTFDP